MIWNAMVEVPAISLLVTCLFAFAGIGAVSRAFKPKVRRWAVIEPSDNHIVAIHKDKELAESLVHEKRYLIELVGYLK